MRECGKTKACEQQPKRGMRWTPSGGGRVVTRPAAKKRPMSSGVQIADRRRIVGLVRWDWVRGLYCRMPRQVQATRETARTE